MSGDRAQAHDGDAERFGLSPLDRANCELLANVHPANWVNPQPAEIYNLVVVGAGPGGLIAAAVAAGLGARVALVERHLMGGDCLNSGCVPSKSLIRAAHRFAERRASPGGGDSDEDAAGINDGDFAATMQRLREVRARISKEDSALRYRDELGVDVFIGSAEFTGRHTLDVIASAHRTELRFKKAVIATGSRALHPDIPGLADAGFLTNETVFNISTLPRRLAVLGAGPIGCELAQAFRRLGAQVTLLERGGQVLPREDADAAQIIARALERDGVRVILGAALERVTTGVTAGVTSGRGAEKTLHYAIAKPSHGETDDATGGNGRSGAMRSRARQGSAENVDATGTAAAEGDTHRVSASQPATAGAGNPPAPSAEFVDEILVAAGRAPNVEGLGLDAAGVAFDSSAGVRVDDYLRSSNPDIYAIGDCAMAHKFTHAADAAAKIAVQNALFMGRKKLNDLVMPWVTYTDPELAHVGMHAHEASRAGRAIDTYLVPLERINRAVCDGAGEGFVKVHTEKGGDRILGATIVAPRAGEMLGEITLAMVGKLGLSTIASVIHPYPSYSEGVKAAANLFMRSKLTPLARRVLGAWLAWQRKRAPRR